MNDDQKTTLLIQLVGVSIFFFLVVLFFSLSGSRARVSADLLVRIDSIETQLQQLEVLATITENQAVLTEINGDGDGEGDERNPCVRDYLDLARRSHREKDLGRTSANVSILMHKIESLGLRLLKDTRKRQAAKASPKTEASAN
ncbi:MAG: hypothetical protein K2X27_15345 [Candidatus Obscuribacterales bacterium]|nr:hypothetical protein [Candidatus Obscuribacterales bacterium]